MIELPAEYPWRTGSKRYRRHDNHRTLYVQMGDRPDEMDPMIGIMDTPPLADAVVRMRAILAELVKLHDGPQDALSASAAPTVWAEARRLISTPIRLPGDV